MYHFEKFKENLPSKEKFYSLLTGKKIVTKNIFMILKGALSGLRQFLTFEGPLKMMKNAFLLHLKSSLHSQSIQISV